MHDVIVGDGVVGLTTAYHLAREGAEVTVVDARGTGLGTSEVNAGWVCPAGSAPVPGPGPGPGVILKSLKWRLRPDSPLYIKPSPKPAFLKFLTGMWRHSHATAAAVALANLDIIENEGLIDNVLALEAELPRLLAPLAQHPDIAGVRTGQGLLAAIELTVEARTSAPGRPQAVAAAMRRAGVLTRSLVDGELQLSPPLSVDTEQVEEFVAAALTGLDETAELAPHGTAREAQVAR